MSWTVEKSNGIYLPQIGWRLDSRKPTSKAFISHAHFDHFGNHLSILCSEGTAQLLKARMPGDREWQAHGFNAPFDVDPGIRGELFPAGHIPGSSMLRLEGDQSSLLYTGDFKLDSGPAAESCVVPRADTLIMETTYGIPKYTFPPLSEVATEMIQFCRESIEDGVIPVLFGYSLGKAQMILSILRHSELDIMLHPQALKMTQACQAIGFNYPDFQPFDVNRVAGHVVISPPLASKSKWLNQIPNRRTATVSGWAVDPSIKYRSGTDKAFPVSDHSDFLELLDFVDLVNPNRVITVHGFASEFAQTLRDRGIDAWELAPQRQLNLDIVVGHGSELSNLSRQQNSKSTVSSQEGEFTRLATTCDTIAKASSHERKITLAAEYLNTLESSDIATACLFLSGRAFPRSSRDRFSLDAKLNRQAILTAADASELDYKRSRKSNADPQSALIALVTRSDGSRHSLQDIRSLIDHLGRAPNPTYQHSLLSDHYKSMGPSETLALTRLVTGGGVGNIDEDIIEDALAIRSKASIESVKRANLRCSDLVQVANAAIDQLLDFVPLKQFYPLRLEPESIGRIDLECLSSLPNPIWSEALFHGLRCQIHKIGSRAELFDESGKGITHKFPEILESSIPIPQDFIAEGYLVAWEKEKPLPLSRLLERIQKHAADLFVGEDVDTLMWLNDLFWFNGDTLIDQPLSYRKRNLDTFSVNPKLRISPVTRLDSAESIPTLLEETKQRGHKGIMVRDETRSFDPSSPTYSRFLFY